MRYFDSSALVKRYSVEDGRASVEALLVEDAVRITSELSVVEVRRAISKAQSPLEAALAKVQFLVDVGAFDIVALGSHLVEPAAVIAEQLGVRTLDAIHLACALRAGCDTLVSFDTRQRAAAQSLGLEVIPAVHG